MHNVIQLRIPEPEPEPTEHHQACQCGNDKFRLAAYQVVICGECGEVQAAKWQREGE